MAQVNDALVWKLSLKSLIDNRFDFETQHLDISFFASVRRPSNVIN